MRIRNYRCFATAAKFGEKELQFNMMASSPEVALTKIRIVRGEDVYRRLYDIIACDHRNHFYSDFDETDRLFSYNLHIERIRRDYGNHYWKNTPGVEFTEAGIIRKGNN